MPTGGAYQRAREAVTTLLELLSRHGSARAEADQQFRDRIGSIEARAERETRELQKWKDEQIEAARADADRRRAEIEQEHGGTLRGLEKRRALTLAEIEERGANERHKIEQNAKQDRWLAETVGEADERNAKTRHAGVNKAVHDARDRIDELVSNAAAWLADHDLDALPAESSSEPSRDDAAASAVDLSVESIAVFVQQTVDEVEAAADRVTSVPLAGVLTPGSFAVIGTSILVLAVLAAGFVSGWSVLVLIGVIVAGGGGLAGAWFGGRRLVASAARARGADLYGEATRARASLRALAERSARRLSEEMATLEAARERETREAAQQYEQSIRTLDARLKEKRDELAGRLDPDIERQRAAFDRLTKTADATLQRRTEAAEREAETGTRELELWKQTETGEAQRAHADAMAALVREWNECVPPTVETLEELEEMGEDASRAWSDPFWSDFAAAAPEPRPIGVGRVRLDLDQAEGGLPDQSDGFQTPGRTSYDVPIALEAGGRASLLVRTPREGRARALGLIRSVMLRVLTNLPAGKVRFTMIDPVGLGESFGAFMHLADYNDQLVSGKIWTDPRHIEQRLADVSEHIENVIQRYLRNEFESIEAYNREAGEIAEPYRFVVIADFPSNFTEESARRLAGIVKTGPRCGVHTIILADAKGKLPTGIDWADLEDASIVIRGEKDEESSEGVRFKVAGGALSERPLDMDESPEDKLLTTLLHRVGAASVDASRVEVPFSAVGPKESELWSRNSASDLRIPIGRTGARQRQEMVFGHGTAQHALVAGKTGSGKSTLFHAIITSAAAWYGPDQLELYLIDFKAGVEFKTYASHDLPHAKVVSIETDRSFGLSVLRRVAEEIEQRGDLFRAAEVQNVAGYRQARPGEAMPRVLLVIDEFQELFTSDDEIGQEAALLLDRLVRQGRAFGIHVVLGSQTLGGAYSLARTTLGQMAIRVALQCNEQDSLLILGEDNPAARLLTRPGEAIYNDQGGLVEANNTFQVVWLGDAVRDRTLERIGEHAQQEGVQREDEIVVFEGHKPVPAEKSRALGRVMTELASADGPVRAVLGEALAIRPPVRAELRRERGAHLLIVGQQGEVALSVLALAAASVGVSSGGGARMWVIDGTREGEAEHGAWPKLVASFPARATYADAGEAQRIMDELREELDKRRAGETGEPAFVLIHGLHRCQALKGDDGGFGGFSFGSGGEEKLGANAAKTFAELLDEGPELGLHAMVWCDTAGSLERMLGRSGPGRFGNRVLMQMSQSDSLTLMDSPAASRLGGGRCLLHREAEGEHEPFRPYAMASPAWFRGLRAPS